MIVYVAVPHSTSFIQKPGCAPSSTASLMQMKRIAGLRRLLPRAELVHLGVNSTAWASYLSRRSLVVSAPPNQLLGISTRTLRSTCSCPGYCLMMSTPNAVISPAAGGLGPLPFGSGRQSHLPSWHEPPASAFQKR